MALLLVRVLPREEIDPAARPSYVELVRSVFSLFREMPILRTRAVLALLVFATFSVLWTSMVLPLTAPPFLLSHTQVGSFGLVGVAGALAAGRAGGLADRGFGQRTTGFALGLMLLSWIPIAMLGVSLWALIVGVVLIDLAVQAVHVTNQSLIFAERPEARSRIVAGYMVFYSIGSAGGSIASTTLYARAGWLGVCALGAALSATALLFWAVTRHTTLNSRHVQIGRMSAQPRLSQQPRRLP